MQSESGGKMPLFWETLPVKGSQGLDSDKIPWSMGWKSKHWDKEVPEI